VESLVLEEFLLKILQEITLNRKLPDQCQEIRLNFQDKNLYQRSCSKSM